MAEDIVKTIEKWGADNIAEAIKILRAKKKTTTGNLEKSLRFEVKKDAQKIMMKLFVADYGDFVNYGIKGSKDPSKAPRSPFKFKSKMPPSGPIDQWVIKKGIKGVRNNKGQFVSRKSLTFAIRKSIFLFGIEPTNFYQPFSKNLKKLSRLITDNQVDEITLLLLKELNDD